MLNPKKPAKAKEENETSSQEGNSEAENAPKKPRKKKEKTAE